MVWNLVSMNIQKLMNIVKKFGIQWFASAWDIGKFANFLNIKLK